MKRGSLITAIFAAACLMSGCYFDRLTSNYSLYFDSSSMDDDSSVLEETGRDDEFQKKRMARLKELSEEEESVYKMNAGDEIEIRVYGHDDLCMTTKLGPDGMIGFAFMGQIRLSGLTISEGADKIREGLEPYVKNPVVSITIKTIESENVTIAGACAKPGVYGISNTTRLADLYALAGSSASRLFNGVDVDIADLDNSIFVRNGEIIPVDFHLAVKNADPLHNIRLRRGDYVFIAQSLESSVTICGDVRSPQKRLYEHGMGLIETLTAAGWMLETHWSHVIIIRDGLVNPKMYKVDVDGILAGKRRNISLKPGDIVYVPKDNLAEYNVFVRKLLPTAQVISLLTSRISNVTTSD